jgi:Barrel-sandwich domain of CusB or HlyD membrane-fusion/GAF domain
MSDAATPSAVVILDQALWRDLTAADDDDRFGFAWLTLVCRLIDGAAAGVLLLLPGKTATPLISSWPNAAEPSLLTAAHAAMHAGRSTVQPGARGAARVAYAVQRDSETIGAVAVDIAGGDARQTMRQLQWAAAWLRDRRRQRDTTVTTQINQRTTLALDLLAAALEPAGFEDACRIAVTELASRFGCDRVSVGFSHGLRNRVAAISHTAQFGQAMSLVRVLAEAMDEAVDQRGPMLFPAPPDAPTLITRAHAALAAGHGAGAIFTVPLLVRDRFAGAVVIERSADQPFDQATLDLAEAMVAILAPALIDKRGAERSLVTIAAERVRAQAVHLFGPGHWGRKLTLAGLATLAAFCLFARGPYRIAAGARLEGRVQRAMVAPFDGFIAAANVKAGDTVRAGQVVAALDDRDLGLERLRWVTERQQHLDEYDQALSRANRADAARFHALAEEAAAQTRLIDEELARTKITAPFDGLVVSGDLSQSIGTPARRGDLLFEIAPLDDWQVVLRVPESQIADVVPGQHGALLVAALPDVALPLTVQRTVPVAEARDGRMEFRVNASLDAITPRLRPGMEGLGQIDAGRARLVWIWFRSLLHWLRLESWAWLP